MTTESDTYLDTFFADFDADKMQTVLDEALGRARMAESMLEAYSAWEANRNGSRRRETDPAANEVVKPPTGQKAILSLIKDGPDSMVWTIPRVAQALGLNDKAHHAIGVSMSRLARHNKIARPRKGYYTKLPSDESRPAGEEAEHGDAGAATGQGVR